MLTTIKQRLGHDEDHGFTLIELMVVVLIIAILLAIAIPTFLGARNTANARAAQSDLRNALTAEQTAYVNGQAFADSTVAAGNTTLVGVEPNLHWATAAITSTTAVNSVEAVTALDPGSVILAALGKDNNCYFIAQINLTNSTDGAPGTFYQETSPAPVTGCSAAALNPPTAVQETNATGSAGTTHANWEQSF
jgi:type IV pilus assembly protein PilA